MQGFFFGGELVGSGFNQSLGVDDSVCIFTFCDYRIGHGDMLVECTDCCSLMNYSLVTTSKEGSLNHSITILFLISPKLVVVLESQHAYPPLTKETSIINKPL